MGIGTNKEHVLGRNQVAYAKVESAAGTFVKPTATDCIRVESSSMKYEPSREPLNEGSEYADEVEMITGKAKATWSYDCDLIPSGTAKTEPRLGVLLTAAMGAGALTGGTHWLYSLSSSQNLGTLSLVRRWSTYLMESMAGAVVEKMTIKLSGGKRSQIKFEGSAMSYVLTGKTQLDGAMVTTDQMGIDASDTNLIGINSVVKIGSDDNSGAGYQVTAGTATPYTIESSISASNDAAVVPFAPTPTWLGSPLSGILGSFTIGGTTLPITDFELTLDRKLSIFDDEYGVQTFSDACPGRREVTGKFDCRIRKDVYYRLANRKSFGTVALVATAGTTTGNRYVATVSQAELGFAEFSSSGDKELTMSVPYRALATTAGNDSFTFDHT